MYDELLSRLESIKGVEVSIDLIDEIFDHYFWICMGFTLDNNKLIYIESPMGKEIDLMIEAYNDNNIIKINDIVKRFWD